MRKILLSAIVIIASSVGLAEACNTLNFSHLSSAQIDRVTAVMPDKSSYQKTDSAEVRLLVDFFSNLSSDWNRMASPPSANLVYIRFHAESVVKEMIIVSGRTLYSGACFRGMTPAERQQLNNLFSFPDEVLKI